MTISNGPVTSFGLVATGAAITTVVGAFCIEIFPHTFLLEKYQTFINIYRFGEKLLLKDDLQGLYDEVLDDLKAEKEVRENFRPFPVIGLNLFNAGMLGSKYGAIIGLPLHFTYKDKHSIQNSELRIKADQEPINMHHPAAEDFVESLILSNNAKKFGIAREVLMAHKSLPLYKAAESSILIGTSIIMADVARVQYKVKSKSLIVMVYGASALLGYSIWFQIRDTLTRYFEKSVDKELSHLGSQYIEGGKEFYDKLLKRNVAIRKLSGQEGSKWFNRDGDEIFFLRNKNIPITHRKRFFNELQFQDEKISA